MATQTDLPVASTAGLKPDAISLRGALMQSITTMSPAITVAFSVPFLAATAGAASPLAVLLAAAVSYLLGYSLAQIARHITSAGSYYTFASRVFGKSLGFMVGWLYLLFYPLAVGMLCALLGETLHGILLSEYGWDVAWWLPAAALMVLVTVISYFGVTISVGVVTALGLFELATMLVLGVWGLVDPGSGGISISWIHGAGSIGGHSFFLAFIFSIYSFTGWDAAAALGEETANPKRSIPIAVLGSIVVLGVFVVVTTWGQLTGWGTSDLNSFVESKSLPVLVLAHRYWNSLWILALLAIVNSLFGAALASMNAATRFMYRLGESGMLPHALSRLTRHRTPSVALVVQTVLNVGVAWGLVAAVGLSNIYNFTGLLFVFSLTFVYLVGSLVVMRLYLTTARDEFNVIKHVLIPVAGAVALIAVSYESLNPAPVSPLNWALPTVLGWAALGLVVLTVRSLHDRRSATGAVQDAGQAGNPSTVVLTEPTTPVSSP